MSVCLTQTPSFQSKGSSHKVGGGGRRENCDAAQYKGSLVGNSDRLIGQIIRTSYHIGWTTGNKFLAAWMAGNLAGAFNGIALNPASAIKYVRT